MELMVRDLSAHEILDSRGRPTLAVTLTLGDGREVVVGVPSGASTGQGEAVERRDADPSRYGGQGVLGAAANVGGELAQLIQSRDWSSQEEADKALRDLDGSADLSRLGANAVVGVSMALARAFALCRGLPLYASLGGEPRLDGGARCLPVPHFNVLNGGAHAQNAVEFQEFMIAPLGAPSFAEALRAGAEVYAALRRRLHDSSLSTGLGDEGGFAPELASPEQACQILVGAIEDAGYRAGKDGISLALDPAANGFREADGTYTVGGERLTPAALVERYAEMVRAYPIYSIEDGMAEGDEDGWRQLTDRLGECVQLVGDDIFVTSPSIIRRAVTARIANAALIKVNQIGTVSQTLEALQICREGGYAAMISHRSGETADDFIADLAVASGCGQIKSGAPARGERVAKYNRLLAIDLAEPKLSYGMPRSHRPEG